MKNNTDTFAPSLVVNEAGYYAIEDRLRENIGEYRKVRGNHAVGCVSKLVEIFRQRSPGMLIWT